MKKNKNNQLFKLSGCKGCSKPCKWNGKFAAKQERVSDKFGCNNSR